MKYAHESLQDALQESGVSKVHHVTPPDISMLTPSQRIELACEALQPLSANEHKEFLNGFCSTKVMESVVSYADHLFFILASREQLPGPPQDFAGLALKAMVRLHGHHKPPLIYNFAKCIGVDRPESNESLMPLNRMPFGLIEYQIQFFACPNTNQVFLLVLLHLLYCV